jgi:CTP:molybdopterin cytidylyltransferase MocA
MNASKALLRLESLSGKTVLDHLAGVYRESIDGPLVIVAQGETLAHACGLEGVTPVEGDPDQPMIDSLARALDHVTADVIGLVAQPVDAPYTVPSIIRALLAGDLGRARVLYHHDSPGHPVFVPRSMFLAIRARPAGGLRVLLQEAGHDRIDTTDARIVADLDTPDDVERWEEARTGGLGRR